MKTAADDTEHQAPWRSELRRLLLAVAVVGGVALVLALRDALLVVFAAVLVALPLHAASARVSRFWRGSRRFALGVVVAALGLLAAGCSWLAGELVASQLQLLSETLPRALAGLESWLAGTRLGSWVLELWRWVELAPQDVSRLAGLAGGTVNAGMQAAGAVTLVLVLGVYLAADPNLYLTGLLRLLPGAAHSRTRAVLERCGHQLSRWLQGQALAMGVVAVMTTAGLALIGMPLALTLGLLAGLLEFVPYVGTFTSSVLIVTVAFTGGEQMALQAALVCAVVQLAEAYVVMPLSQRWAVRMPPALALLAVMVFALLLQLPGVLLAVPLMVLLMTVVVELHPQAAPQPATDAGIRIAGARVPRKTHRGASMNTATSQRTVISSDRVEGTAVYNASGEKLGTIDTLMIDKESGYVRYAVMEFGGFLGIGTDRYPLPWGVLKYDTDKEGYVVPVDRSMLENGPRHPAQEWPEYTEDYGRKIYDYYGVAWY